MEATAATPFPVSMMGRMSKAPASIPRSRSSCETTQSTVRSSEADSSFGSTIPSTPGVTTAWRSPQQKGVSTAFTRT